MAQLINSTQNAKLLGDIVKISEDIYSTEAITDKIDEALKYLNDQRKQTKEAPLSLDKILKVTRQVTNGFLYVFTVNLTNEDLKTTGCYKINYFQKHGKPENTEITLEEEPST